MGNLAGFDANQYEDFKAPDYDPLPVGEYIATIDASDRKQNKNGAGERLALTWKVLSPNEFQGRLIFDSVTISNDNQQAVDIGNRQLASICKATGVLRPTDSSEFHGIACKLKLKIEPAKNGYPPKNRITEYTGCNSGETISSTPAAKPSTPPASGKTAPPPWQQKKN